MDFVGPVDGGKNPSQQRETLLIPQVPIRLTNVWCGRLDGIMDPLPSKVWFMVVCFKAQEHKMSQLSVDGGKNPSQQRETLPVPQVPIRLKNVWCGRLDGIMDPLPF